MAEAGRILADLNVCLCVVLVFVKHSHHTINECYGFYSCIIYPAGVLFIIIILEYACNRVYLSSCWMSFFVLFFLFFFFLETGGQHG